MDLMDSAHGFRSLFSPLHLDHLYFIQNMAPKLVYKNDIIVLMLKRKQISRMDFIDNYDLQQLIFPCTVSILFHPNFPLLHHPLLSYF